MNHRPTVEILDDALFVGAIFGIYTCSTAYFFKLLAQDLVVTIRPFSQPLCDGFATGIKKIAHVLYTSTSKKNKKKKKKKKKKKEKKEKKKKLKKC